MDKADFNANQKVKNQEETHRSIVAQELGLLRGSIMRVISKRERLAVPFFWSLFHCEINKIKEQKKAKRTLEEVIYY